MTNRIDLLIYLEKVKVSLPIPPTSLTGLDLVDYKSDWIEEHLSDIRDSIDFGQIVLNSDNIDIDYEREE